MRYELIHNETSDRLILIFAGWSTDPAFYLNIEKEGYDVMVVWDYSDLSFPDNILDKYSTVCLFAWSLGVYAASVSLPWEKISMAIAVNGTETPVDDSRGIPVQIFSNTIERLDTRNLLKFRKRMTDSYFNELINLFSSESPDSLKQELINILHTSGCQVNHRNWDRVIISSRDAIFPPSNMEKAWRSSPFEPEIVSIDAPHYIPLKSLVDGVIPFRERVGERFKKAMATYDSTASVQLRVARNLSELLPNDSATDNLLEIGPGSGILCKELSKRFNIRTMDFIDLFMTPEYGVAKKEQHFSGDAEDWLEENANLYENKYDMIVSASAFQWFVNPQRCFLNCKRLLKPDGLLVFATYLPGTLKEMRSINPHTLVYRSQEQIYNMLTPLFKKIEMTSEEYRLDFKSSKETLIHLINTGVGGSSGGNSTVHEIFSKTSTSLTYRPLYVIAR